MSGIMKDNKDVHTNLSCLQVIVKGIHLVGQAVNVVKDFMVQGPIQAIGDVHLVKVFLHTVIGKEGVQGPLVPLKDSWGRFLSHGTFGKQNSISSVLQILTLPTAPSFLMKDRFQSLSQENCIQSQIQAVSQMSFKDGNCLSY